MYSSKGKIHLDAQNNLKLVCDEELVNYYLWFLRRQFPDLKLQRPKHNSHINIVFFKYAQNVSIEKLKSYIGELVSFRYTNEIKSGGCDFVNFWLPCYSERCDLILKELGIVYPKFLGFHLTIANNKNVK